MSKAKVETVEETTVETKPYDGTVNTMVSDALPSLDD